MSTLARKTPYEALVGKIPSLLHLIVFVFDAFEHIPKERRKKLDNKVEKCIFIGYKDGIKGYKLWNPTTRNIFYSKDVICREDDSTFEDEEVRIEK